MKRQSSNLIRYHGGTIRKVPGGWRAELSRNGKRYRQFRTEVDDLKKFIDTTAADHADGRSPLTPSQVSEYRTAVSKLPPGFTLLDAVLALSRNAEDEPSVQMTVAEAVKAFLSDKKAAGLRERSLYSLKWSLAKITRAMGDRQMASVAPADLMALLDGMNPVTRDNHRRIWRGFFKWAIAANYCGKDPARAISRSVVDAKVPAIFTVEQATKLLQAAEEVDGGSMAPFIAFGLFAGLRTYGILRIEWSDVKDTVIHVTPSVEKMREARFIDIQPNLAAWIEKYKGKGRVCPYAQKHAFEVLKSIRAKAKVPWPKNAMRHSFASYLLALVENSGKVALELGHHSPDMLYQHYRALVGRADAVRYFNIKPVETVQKLSNTDAGVKKSLRKVVRT